MMKRPSLMTAIFLLALLGSSSSAQSFHNHAFLWTAQGGMQDLGVPLGMTDSSAAAISISGRVVGNVVNANIGTVRAAMWTSKNGWQPLKGGVSSQYSTATAINSSGQVVGATYTTGTIQHAFLWTFSDGMVDLGTLGGDASTANGINNLGQVVGSSTTADGFTHAFLWTQGGGMRDLGTLQGPTSFSSAWAINNQGVIAGYSTGQEGSAVAVVWVNGKIQSLGKFSPPGAFVRVAPASAAGAINNHQQVVGGYGKNQTGYPFLWTQSDGVQDLGLLPGASSGNALGINLSGQVVGIDQMSDGSQVAFFWTSLDGMQALGTLGGPYSIATGINDLGQVVGYSETP